MRFPRPFRLLCSSALIAAASSAASAQVVTVSATPGAADETSIQAAVASLLPGGSRDDGNPDNNVVTIIDSAVYTEALSLAGFTGTIAGVAPTRPTIIASLQQAAANPGASAIHIASDGTVALRRLVVLPHAANPANTGILATGQTADNAGDLVLDRVLVSANDGSNAPASVDGLSAPGPGASRFLGNAFEVAGGRPGRQVRFDEVVLTGATGGGADLVRFRASDTTMTINAGSVLSHSQGAGLRANAGAASAIRWIGEPDAPVLLHGNAGPAIANSIATTQAAAAMEWTAVLRNSTAQNAFAIQDAYNGSATSLWNHTTVAGNSTRDGASPSDGPLSIAGPFTLRNTIIAGDGMETVRQTGNIIRLVGASAALRGLGLCIDTSQGATTLNIMRADADADYADGVSGGSPIPLGAGIVNASPAFLSLDPASPDFLAVTGAPLRGAGPAGADLVGAGRFEEIPFSPIRTLSGNLQVYMGNVIVPGSTSSSKFRQPTADELAIFAEALDDLAAFRYQAAANRLSLVNYDLIIYRDTVEDRRYAVMRERTNAQQHWGGLHILDLEPRTKLVIESPHPLFDGTRIQAHDLFFRTEAFGFTQSGTHRNNSDIISPCDGTFTGGAPYRISDVAHNDLTFFQVFNDQMHRRFPEALAVNVHGMGQDADPSDVVISNGTGANFNGPSISRDIADTMNAILSAAGDPRFAVSHQEPGESPIFSGSTNTQGRFINGSHAPCTVAVPALFPERFIHMEQAPSVRSGTDTSRWDFVVDAYNILVPDFDPWVQPFTADGSLLLSLPLDGGVDPAEAQSPVSLAGTASATEDRFGDPGGALELGEQSYVEVGEFAYDGEDREFTISFWFRVQPKGSGFHYLYSHGSVGESNTLSIPSSLHAYTTGAGGGFRVRFTLQQGDYLVFDGPSGFNDGQWRFFALSYSAADGTTIYLDGEEAFSAPDHGAKRFLPEGPILVGARTDLSPTRFASEGAGRAAFDDLRIHNTALDADAVLALFQSIEPLPTTWLLQ